MLNISRLELQPSAKLPNLNKASLSLKTRGEQSQYFSPVDSSGFIIKSTRMSRKWRQLAQKGERCSRDGCLERLEMRQFCGKLGVASICSSLTSRIMKCICLCCLKAFAWSGYSLGGNVAGELPLLWSTALMIINIHPSLIQQRIDGCKVGHCAFHLKSTKS